MSGNTLPDDMDLLYLLLRHPLPDYVEINGVPTTTTSTTTTTTTTTRRPDHYYDFDGYTWIWYDLERLPRSYLNRNVRESFELIFRAIRPDGLLWYTGNDQNNMHLSLRVRISYRITTTTT